MVDLIEPTRWDSPAGRYLHSWGPGPYTIRIAYMASTPKPATSPTAAPPSPCSRRMAPSGRRLRIDPADLDGLLIELVEFQPKA